MHVYVIANRCKSSGTGLINKWFQRKLVLSVTCGDYQPSTSIQVATAHLIRGTTGTAKVYSFDNQSLTYYLCK